VDPDPDPGGPKTYGSGGSGSATLLFSSLTFKRTTEHKILLLLLFEGSFTSFFRDKKS
jgi:hypothetical protein